MYNSLKVAKSVDSVYRSGVSQYINVEFKICLHII